MRELDGWALFGASTGATLVTFTIAMAWSGSWTDRAGPRPVLLWGMAAFVLAQVVSGLAPTMAVFVAGRTASGAAEALIDTALMVLVAQALPEALRAKIFASFAAAWILPSLLGPSLAGAIDAVWGWRLVFVAPLLVVPVALLLLRPALRRTHAGGASAAGAEATASDRRRVAAALLLAAGLAVTTFSAPLLSDPGHPRHRSPRHRRRRACSSWSVPCARSPTAWRAWPAGCRPSSRCGCSCRRRSPRWPG